MHVLGRDTTDGQTAELGHHRAADGSTAAPLAVDLEHPHAGLIVGKRGSGKSHTLGVIAEGVTAGSGVVGVVIDPMGGLRSLADHDRVEVLTPSIPAESLPPRAWCSMLDLDPAGAVGSVIWRATDQATSLDEIQTTITDATVDQQTQRAAENHIHTVQTWDIFDPNGITPSTLLNRPLTVVDVSALPQAPMNAVVRGLTDALYETAVSSETIPLPWVLIDEAHAFFDGIAEPGLHRLLTRGRHPGISLFLATQRPTALPAVAISQADLLIAHRLTAAADLDALETARPTYLRESLRSRRPTATGDALIVDDATEVARAVSIRDRRTPDHGTSPTASTRATTASTGE